MSRAKPYRRNPTREFNTFLDVALQSRYYLVAETGPTKLTLEATNQKKYKIQIGSEISCSCGGGRKEHCVHTIYTLLKIFRIDQADPMLWQLSYTDDEINKMLDKREREQRRNRQIHQEWQSQARSLGSIEEVMQYRDSIRRNNEATDALAIQL